MPWARHLGSRIAVDNATRVIQDPSERCVDADCCDLGRTAEWVKEHLIGVEDPRPNYGGVCLQTNVYDNMFVLDHFPDTHKSVSVFTAGWAMKFVPVIGEILAHLAVNKGVESCDSSIRESMQHFSISRRDGKGGHVLYVKNKEDAKRLLPTRSCLGGGSSHKPTSQVNAKHSHDPSEFMLYLKKTLDEPRNARLKLFSQCHDGGFDKSMLSTSEAKCLKELIRCKLVHEHRGNLIVPPQVLPGKGAKLKVGIVGAGMAGLYAAIILKDLGIDFDILEANPKRIGGRVYTYHFDSKDEFDYFEVGAMRFPKIKIMDRLLGDKPNCLVKFLSIQTGIDLKMTPYYLSSTSPDGISDPVGNPLYYNGIYGTSKDEEKDPDHFKFSTGGDINEGAAEIIPMELIKKGSGAILDEIYLPFKQKFRNNFKTGHEYLRNFDHHSTRSYISQQHHFDGMKCCGDEQTKMRVAHWLETRDSGTGLYDMAFSESVIDSYTFDAEEDVDWVCFEEGTDSLVKSMLKYLGLKRGVNFHRGCRVHSYERVMDGTGEFVARVQVQIAKTCDDSEAKGQAVDEVELKNVSGDGKVVEVVKEYDHVINTTTLSMLRTFDLSSFSGLKQNALRQLRYDSSTKIGIRFECRWWQKVLRIKGGSSYTDSPLRVVVYPSYGNEMSSGVMIISYTWHQDAQRMGTLVDKAKTREDKVNLAWYCIKLLAEFFPGEIKEKLLDKKSGLFDWDKVETNIFGYNWDSDPYALGAFALFGPGQFMSLYDDLLIPEMNGRLHFSGEAVSLNHGWIVGALDASYRCVEEIVRYSGNKDEWARKLADWSDGNVQRDDSEVENKQDEDSKLYTTSMATAVPTRAKKSNMTRRNPRF
eukprot:TRINITY_DN5953_c0_g1_i2.p1 TRINITY_DN5953_c0_g1~~TRINITY_DN5953_c0_g1_i2.p1  ORF type:complete len:867 (-),score=210.06 TRINITY_DN5953_c0_g1_i2:68-2668(-)